MSNRVQFFPESIKIRYQRWVGGTQRVFALAQTGRVQLNFPRVVWFGRENCSIRTLEEFCEVGFFFYREGEFSPRIRRDFVFRNLSKNSPE